MEQTQTNKSVLTFRSTVANLIGPKATRAVRLLIGYLKLLTIRPPRPSSSQSNEAVLIDWVSKQVKITPTFCEFGFSIFEFNCSRLALRGFRGLLIDADTVLVRIAAMAVARKKLDAVKVRQAFLDRSNIQGLVASYFRPSELGVLSIDVDGNDYWFLKDLLPLRPDLVVVEYNASFGLRSITVPYDATFDRAKKHRSGWYHGASLTALVSLCASSGYQLAEVSDAGLNLLFLRGDLAPDGFRVPIPSEVYRENRLRNDWSKTSAAEQWQRIKHLQYVEV
jgi:hypothetical protein